MMKKQKEVSRFWVDDKVLESYKTIPDFFDYSQFDSLEKFNGTHPLVMEERIKRLNWQVTIDPTKKKFSLKDKALYHFEKVTGIRLFDFRKYQLIR